MVKVSIRLDKRYKNAEGKYPLKLTFSRCSKTVYIPIGVNLRQEDWDAKGIKVLNQPNRKMLTLNINRILLRAQEKITELQSKGKLRSMSDEEIARNLSELPSYTETSFFQFNMSAYMESLKNKNTKRLYEDTERHMMEFCESYQSLSMDEIDMAWLSEYEDYFSDKLAVNTLAIDFRNIRKIFNYAIDNDRTANYPFRKYKIKKEQTRKRSLTIEQLRALRDYEGTPTERKYIDLFMLTFYLMGINAIDLSRITEVQDGRIAYKRAKTGTQYDIKVEPEAQRIVQRYRGSKHLLAYFDTNKDYTSVVKKAEKKLKEVSKKLGFNKETANGISLYWARHTFATIAANIDIPVDTISECLGHKHGSKITAVYINFDQKKVDEANRKVINYVNEC